MKATKLRLPAAAATLRLTGHVRLLGWVVAFLGAALPVSAIELVVDRDGGGVYLKNEGLGSEVIDAYSISSAGGSLLPGSWTPVAGNYDLSGDQSVDPSSDWFEISTPTATGLAEASLVEGSGSLGPGQVVSLGAFFNTGLAEDLLITTAANGSTSSPFAADYRTLTADYDGDLVVDFADYALFFTTFGSTVDLRADGNGDGVVDAADYTVWRDSPELSLPSAEVAALVASYPVSGLPVAVPEPSAAVLTAGLLAATARRRR